MEIEDLLTELEAESGKYWNVPRTTARFLFEMLRFLSFSSPGEMNVLEIGTSNGYSGIWLANALASMKEKGKLYTIESHDQRFELAKGNFKRSGLDDYIVQVKGHAPEIFLQKDGSFWPVFEMVFMDATKMEYISYFDEVLFLMSRGGLIVADNCLSHFKELEGFFDHLDSRNCRYHLLPIDNGLLLIDPTVAQPSRSGDLPGRATGKVG